MAIERQSDAYAVWKISNFRAFITGRFFLTFAIQMQSVIIGWQVYALTHDPFSLGLIGLAEAIPFISMALLAGHVADRHNRRIIIILTASAYVICAGILLAMSFRINELYSLYGIFPIVPGLCAVACVVGLARRTRHGAKPVLPTVLFLP